MACEDKQQAFKDKLIEVQQTLRDELAAIATDTEAKAHQIADDFEADHDLSTGVGAAAGTAVGAAVGGPGGAFVGNIIGRTIGSLFTLEIGMRRASFSLDVPQVSMKTQDFSFDLPTVVMRDTDLSFDLPTIEMRREEGPPIPETTVRWTTQCVDLGWPIGKVCTDLPETTVTWTPTYLDVPVTVMKTQRIVIGLPQVEMSRQEFKMDVPEFSMQTTEFSADVPYITLRFIKDAGQRTAALAAALAQSAQEAAVQRQIAFKERTRAEVAPLAAQMFDCMRGQLVDGRAAVLARYTDQIQTLQNSVTAIAAAGVPQDNAELKQARDALDAALAEQTKALAPLDAALEKLAESARTAMSQFLGEDGKDLSRAAGGLIKATFTGPAQGRVAGLIGLSPRGVATGRYLTIGLNRIDPAAYGTSGALMACENDARDIAALATQAGFSGTTLLNEKATSSAVLAQLASEAANLQSGDVLLVGYSGHGGQVGDVTGDEDDALDETWCLYDRQLIDDELYAMWSRFRAGVRIVILSDSCHSGTVSKALSIKLNGQVRNFSMSVGQEAKLDFQEIDAALMEAKDLAFGAEEPAVKALPLQRCWAMYMKNKAMYDSLQLVAGADESTSLAIKASVLLLSGCQDNQLSRDGVQNGAFTAAVKAAWNAGAFNGSYRDFYQAVRADRGLRSDQTPNYYWVGAANLAFEAQRPFTI